MKEYKATISPNQSRKSLSMIFRHPLRKDLKGKVGLRIRRGLNTSDLNEAEKLVAQMNDLLKNDSLWNLSAKELAGKRYDPIIVSAFYDSLETSPNDYMRIREEFLPLPSSIDGYVRVLFAGTTGAGKTTLLRQVIGSDPVNDKFPSTSAARTTVSDIEVITADTPYRAIVTFFNEAEIRLLVGESIAQAVINAAEGGNNESIARRLLEHKEQRFRLSYLLGNYKVKDDIEDEDTEEDDTEESYTDSQGNEPKYQEITEQEREELNLCIEKYISCVIKIANITKEKLKEQKQLDESIQDSDLKNKPDDQDRFEELIFENKEFEILVDELTAEIEKRFDFIKEGVVERDTGEWPKSWKFETEDREIFIKAIRRFSSNYSPLFGRLLTPIVQGIRVQGPLYPNNWLKEHPRLVLMDGQGLGHTPDSASSLPTTLTRRFDEVDVILLVDSAKQPMLASSLAVLRSVGSSGHHSKLAIAFTHFDEVVGDNLPDTKAKKYHVLNQMGNGLTTLKDILGPSMIHSLERELENRCFFLGHLQKRETDKRTRKELEKLLDTFKSYNVFIPTGPAIPIYDDAFLLFALQGATKDFHSLWNARLGLSYLSGVDPAHWAKVKALSRRIADFGQDQYDYLTPVADLISRLTERISLYLNNPVRWESEPATEDEKQQILDAIRRAVFNELHPLINDCLIADRLKDWVVAHEYRGTGSTKVRAREIAGIYDKGAPLLAEVPSPEALDFLTDIRTIVKEAINSGGGLVKTTPPVPNIQLSSGA